MSEVAVREHGESAVRYVVIWAVLIGLTGLTYGLGKVELGAASLVIALAIAVTKTALVLVFFMELMRERGVSQLTMAVAVIFLTVLSLLVIADVGTRFPLAVVHEEESPIHPIPATRQVP